MPDLDLAVGIHGYASNLNTSSPDGPPAYLKNIPGFQLQQASFQDTESPGKNITAISTIIFKYMKISNPYLFTHK